jgi:hypothetical protein
MPKERYLALKIEPPFEELPLVTDGPPASRQDVVAG